MEENTTQKAEEKVVSAVVAPKEATKKAKVAPKAKTTAKVVATTGKKETPKKSIRIDGASSAADSWQGKIRPLREAVKKAKVAPTTSKEVYKKSIISMMEKLRNPRTTIPHGLAGRIAALKMGIKVPEELLNARYKGNK
jgi:hypothetical protein